MEPRSVGERLFWCYANLAMSHAAVSEGEARFGRRHFIIRSRLYAGLRKGTMKTGPLADDEKLKMILPQACAYCGAREFLSVDHLVPHKLGGSDDGENMVWACRSCNSSKGAADAIEWITKRGRFPPLLLLRRYLKLAIAYCSENGAMDQPPDVSTIGPFSLASLPQRFPEPNALTLWTVALEGD